MKYESVNLKSLSCNLSMQYKKDSAVKKSIFGGDF